MPLPVERRGTLPALGNHERRDRSLERRPPPDTSFPMHQHISLPVLQDFGNTGPGASIVIDALCNTNHRLQITAQDALVTFMFLLGPQFSLHEIFLTALRGPDYGIGHFYLANLQTDGSVGADVPDELIAGTAGGADPPADWLHLYDVDFYNATVVRNDIHAYEFRVSGEPGAALTAQTTDSDGYAAIDSGPGLYAMQIRMETKNASSSGYKGSWSEIHVDRTDEVGFL